MKDDIFSRNELFWGSDFQNFLASKGVAVFGLGGVGGYCAEMLVRAGIGKIVLVDFDCVSVSNINRQIVALHSTVGHKKTELFYDRLKDINPDIEIVVADDFYQDDEQFPLKNIGCDFVVDAIDTMRSKINLLKACVENNVPVISSMGAGNRVNPTELYICDIKDIENKNMPFVSNVLYQLKKSGINSGVMTVTSKEKPFVNEKISETEKISVKSGADIEFKKIIPASTPFVASVSGIYMAYYIISEFEKEFKNG